MKLDHDVVKDLYPLYIDGDLSPRVKQAVTDHLEECVMCGKYYETGENSFFMEEGEEIKAPESLDEKILFKMKLNRLKLIIFILISMIVSMVITDYKNEREKLFDALQEYYGILRFLPNELIEVKNGEEQYITYTEERIHEFFEAQIQMEQYLNWYEKHALQKTESHLSLKTGRLNSMLQTLQMRHNQGRWSETDEAALQAIEENFNGLQHTIQREYEEMHHGYSSYFEALAVREMDGYYEKINKLTYSYTTYHKLPHQIVRLDESSLKKRIADATGVSKKKITLEKESSINEESVYRFNTGPHFGEIDAVTGQILEYYNSDTARLTDEPLISEKLAAEKAKGYLESFYTSANNLEIIPLGFNHNYSSDNPKFKVYSYKVIPKVGDFKLYTIPDSATYLHIDARSGELLDFSHNPHAPSFEPLKQVDLSIKVSQDQINKKGFSVQETVIIYSALSGEYELVHRAISKGDQSEMKYFSAKTGEEELIYFNQR